MSGASLTATNTPQSFWCISDPISPQTWARAIESAQRVSRWPFQTPLALDAFLDATLGEGQFGPTRYTLGRAQSAYYSVVRPVLPVALRPAIRSLWRRRRNSKPGLGWPIEDRYVRFQYDVLRSVFRLHGVESLEMQWFWPQRSEFALCLTHDVEGQAGHDFVTAVMELEERMDFRSSFNFVPSDYHVDPGLLEELRSRGFEVGVHGLTHDGKLFRSRKDFDESAARINHVLRTWQATGFRSPLTHRQPEWMQALEIEYDLSFFDTDPYEPMPGGTMSIWPFFLGKFVELPYTLPQDHTLFELGERSPRLWQEKVRFIRAHHGLALVNVHPDYLRKAENLAVYREFLSWLDERRTFWHALPRDVAARWRQRSSPQRSPAEQDMVRVVCGSDGVFFADLS